VLKEFETTTGDIVFIEPEEIVYLSQFGADTTCAHIKGIDALVWLKGNIHDVATFIRRGVEFNG
jgi:hypothetical protein